MSSHSRAFLWRLALLLAGLSMFGPFAIDAIFPAFPELQAQFGDRGVHRCEIVKSGITAITPLAGDFKGL